MANLKEEIKECKNRLKNSLDLLDDVYNSMISDLFDKNIRREAMAAEDGRKRIKGVEEEFLRREFKNKDNLIVLKAVLLELEYIEHQLKLLSPMIPNYDGSPTLMNMLNDLNFSNDIIIESIKQNSKKDLMRLFKVKELDKMNSFYTFIKWNELDRGLPDIAKNNSKLLDGTPKHLREKRKDNKPMRFFARTKDDVALSAVDFFSIGHILMGQIFFFIVYGLIAPSPPLFYDAPFVGVLGANYGLWCVVIAVIIGIIWEPIENILLWKLGMKFESRRDSILNIVFDILFVTAGALFALIYDGFWLHVVVIAVEMVLFFILRWYFLTKT